MVQIQHTIVVSLLCICLLGCNEENTPQQLKQPLFTNIAEQAGLTVKHNNGMDGNMYFVEMMGPACAFFDYDNDGDLDIYIGQGGPLTDHHDKKIQHGTLYRNELNTGTLTFTDVTQSSGLIAHDYSMGIATGDINNDGYVDVYLTNFGNNRLFLNNKNGTFSDITTISNSNDHRWSSSAAFFDANGDNWLDLYVANYVDYRIDKHKACINQKGQVDYCGPDAYPNVNDKLLINTGDNTFTDQSTAYGIDRAGAGLGVVTADFNGDQKTDIYVTNDMGHNFLWIKQDKHYINQGLMRGSAVNKHGKPEASMGVDTGDVDNDGDFDLFMTHLLNETNTFYQNDGSGYFTDATSTAGLAEPSKGFTGFGTAFLDYDNDGWLDIFAINGEVRLIEEQVAAGIEMPLQQANQLFHNRQGQFIEVTDQVPAMLIEKVSRGSAIGDVDNDGDTDILVTNNHDVPELLINQVGQAASWIGLQLQDRTGKYLLGSVARVKLSNGQTIIRRSHTDASYISANDPRIIIGLGTLQESVDVEVLWSDGQRTTHTQLMPQRYHQLLHPLS